MWGKKQFSGIGQQTPQKYNPQGKVHNRMSSRTTLSYCPERFSRHKTKRNQMQYGTLTVLKAQRLEFKLTKMIRFYGAEHQRKELHILRESSRNLQRALFESFSSILISSCK